MECSVCGGRIPEDHLACPNCGSLSEHTLITQRKKVLMLGERYSIVAVLGRGGFGTVYLARDLQLGETVAVKTLPVEVASDPSSVEQLKKEVLLARQLRHENIAAVYNFEVDRLREIPFIVMEYVDGADLCCILREAGGRLGVRETLMVAQQVAAALDYAHSKRLIHRDIKPKNILVRRDGAVKVTDFGVARRVRETMTRISQTVIAGTPAYMAPEHLMGEPIDQTADIYSLAATIYECLCGHPPFWQGSIEAQILKREPEPIPYELLGPEISPEAADALNRALLKGLAKKPSERPETAMELMEALNAAVGGERSDRALLGESVVAVLRERAKYMRPLDEAPGASAPLDAAELAHQAEKALKEGEFAKAVWFLQRLQRIAPSEKTEERIRDIKRMQDRYHRLRQEAKEAEEQGDLEDALRLMKQAAELRPVEEVEEQVERLSRLLEAERLRGEATIHFAERNWEALKQSAEKIEELGFPNIAAPLRECLEEAKLFEEFRQKVERMLRQLDEEEGEGAEEAVEEAGKWRPEGLRRLGEDVAEWMSRVEKAASLWRAVRRARKAMEAKRFGGIRELEEELKRVGLSMRDFVAAVRSGDAPLKYPYIGERLTHALLELRQTSMTLARLTEADEYFARGWFALAARKYQRVPEEFFTQEQRARREKALMWERSRRRRNLFYIALTIWGVLFFIILVAILS